jgi:serine/threonine protein kinase
MSAARAPKPGDVLGGKYRVERVLGSGGMGVVVAAKHIELGQRVALKFMLKEAMVDPSHAERFLREAKASVQLKSVHTARVLDVGKLKNGEPFMVMEYLEGRDLDEELKQKGPLPPHVSCNFILQAAEALAEAHGLGMIHRDVKLKNLFLTTTVDGRPLVKVLDFGLAKQTGIGNGDVSLTATSSVFGSPQYMSPEQMRSAKDVDTRSDIWSLGVCLYELLTGRVPFDAGGVAEICAMVLKDPVPPPSRWVRGLPADLEAVVLKCLEKDPRVRFQTVAELAFALEAYAAEEGSARRILHVMETAQKVDIPTLMTDPSHMSGDEGRGRTMAAFSTGAQTTRNTRPPWVLIGVSSGLFMAVVTLFIAMAVTGKLSRSPATSATQSAPATEVTPLTPVPVPSPVPSPGSTTTPEPTGTVIGASAEPATTVATAGTAHLAKPNAGARPVAGAGQGAPPPSKPNVAPKPTGASPPQQPTAKTTATATPPPKPTATGTDPGGRF